MLETFDGLGRVLLCAVVQFVVVSGVSPMRCADLCALEAADEPEQIILDRIPGLEVRELRAPMTGLWEVY